MYQNTSCPYPYTLHSPWPYSFNHNSLVPILTLEGMQIGSNLAWAANALWCMEQRASGACHTTWADNNGHNWGMTGMAHRWPHNRRHERSGACAKVESSVGGPMWSRRQRLETGRVNMDKIMTKESKANFCMGKVVISYVNWHVRRLNKVVENPSFGFKFQEQNHKDEKKRANSP